MRQKAAPLPAKASAVERIVSDVFMVGKISSVCGDLNVWQPVPVDGAKSTPGR